MKGKTIQTEKSNPDTGGPRNGEINGRKEVAFALGGLGGNNAHGVGFLEAALTKGVEPVMISCTSGQIYWVFEYLRCLKAQKSGDKDHASLRSVLQEKIDALGWFHPWLHNYNLDLAYLSFWGKSGVYKPAGLQYFTDAWRNAVISWARMCSEGFSTFVARRLLEIVPDRLLIPDFSEDFYRQISEEFLKSHIGIVFNSYDAAEGHEYVYLNEKARELLKGGSAHPRNRYNHDSPSSYRDRTTYRNISPQAVRRGLWLYFYGVGGKGDSQLDGAYYRQIILSELTQARVIYVIRPLHFHWSDCLPRNWPEMEDFKTKLGFNGAYAGERYQIELVNKVRKDLKDEGKYHEIKLIEIELDQNRGFYGYVFEDMGVFEEAFLKAMEALPSAKELAAQPAPTVTATQAEDGAWFDAFKTNIEVARYSTEFAMRGAENFARELRNLMWAQTEG